MLLVGHTKVKLLQVYGKMMMYGMELPIILPIIMDTNKTIQLRVDAQPL